MRVFSDASDPKWDTVQLQLGRLCLIISPSSGVYKSTEESEEHRLPLQPTGLTPALYCIRQHKHLCVDAAVIV